MAEKKQKAKKPSGYDKLSQKEKFIAAAKAGEADESGQTFSRAMKIITTKKKGAE
jgi:hypothetical protein